MRTIQMSLILLSAILLGSTDLFAQDDIQSPSNALVESLRLRQADDGSTMRFVQFGGIAIVAGLLLWAIHRGYQSFMARREGPEVNDRRRPSRMYSRKDQGLATLGLDANERGFITRLARHSGLDPDRLVNHRTSFEQSVEGGRDFIHSDPGQEATLRSIRDKLGWTGAPGTEAVAVAPLPVDGHRAFDMELNQEVELFGTGAAAGYCARAVLIYRDEHHLVLRFYETLDGSNWKSGDVAQIYFWRANDAGYLLRSRIQEFREQAPGFLVLTHPESIERQQKRIYVRVPIESEIRFLHLPLADVGALLGNESRAGGLYSGVLEDLSAGGFRVTTAQSLRSGDYLVIPEFAPAGNVEVMVRVVSELPAPSGTQDGSAVVSGRRFGVQYIGVSAVDRDSISRTVFTKQRESIVARSGVLSNGAEASRTPSGPATPRPVPMEGTPSFGEAEPTDVTSIAEQLEQAFAEEPESDRSTPVLDNDERASLEGLASANPVVDLEAEFESRRESGDEIDLESLDQEAESLLPDLSSQDRNVDPSGDSASTPVEPKDDISG